MDITVGEIYGTEFSMLLKDLIASSMGKNEGKTPQSFLKSYIFCTAINAANLCAMIANKEQETIQIVVPFDLMQHKFSDFFMSSLLQHYRANYNKMTLESVCLQNSPLSFYNVDLTN